MWEQAELRHLRRFVRAVAALDKRGPRLTTAATIRPLTILDLPAGDLYGRHWSLTGRRRPGANTRDEAVYLPGRNLLLLSKAVVFCARHNIPVLAIGSLGHNPFPDATPGFFRDFARAASGACQFCVTIVTPFRQLTKAKVIRRGRPLPLHLSFSCISPKRGRHCGRCNKCAERRRAFAAAGAEDRTAYAQ